ncbi:hypothetical protein [Agromyces sp. NPDC057865]|uniref:hypothetical protein n=1 Tax=Agromyces sp. NPDC057865 TaxID=3346267 RepID=UPI00366DB889
MQLSADFTSLHGHRADAARGERELEFRRIAEERRALEAQSAPEAPAAPLSHHRRARRTARLALR